MTNHALLSPSSASRWLACPAALWESKDSPDSESEHAREGTAAHALAEQCFITGKDPIDYIGKPIMVGYEVDEDMVDYITEYVNAVRADFESTKALDPLTTMTPEQRLNFTSVLELDENSFGTSDNIICGNRQLKVWDLKYGKGVSVKAEGNKQLLIYALAAYDLYSMLSEIDEVTMVIHQPRLYSLTTWTISVTELLEAKEIIQAGAHKALNAYREGPKSTDYCPGDVQCQFCPAKGKCHALADYVLDLVAKDFEDISDLATPINKRLEEVKQGPNEDLAHIYSQVKLIKGFCDGVSTEVHYRLASGDPVPGYKLVSGRAGNRKWSDESEAEQALKSFRLKQEQMYKIKVISPTDAESLLKKASPKRWNKLTPLITRSEGKATVAPESDKRPAITAGATINDFEDVSNQEETN